MKLQRTTPGTAASVNPAVELAQQAQQAQSSQRTDFLQALELYLADRASSEDDQAQELLEQMRGISWAIGDLVEGRDYVIQPDYSIQTHLSDGTVVVLRDLTGEDLEFVEKASTQKMPQVELTARLVSRICTKWGDRPGVTVPEIKKARAKDNLKLAQVSGLFLQ